MCRLKSAYGHIIQACQLLVFFGAPHNGLRTEELEAMVDDLGLHGAERSHELLVLLRENSKYLEENRDNLAEIWKGKKIITCHELALSPVVRKVSLWEPMRRMATNAWIFA